MEARRYCGVIDDARKGYLCHVPHVVLVNEMRRGRLKRSLEDSRRNVMGSYYFWRASVAAVRMLVRGGAMLEHPSARDVLISVQCFEMTICYSFVAMMRVRNGLRVIPSGMEGLQVYAEVNM